MPGLENTLIAAVVVTITSLTLLLSRDWRVSIFILAGQYVGVFFLVSSSWPLMVAAIILIGGWISSIVLVMAVLSVPEMVQTADFVSPTGSWRSPQWVVTFLRLMNERAFYILAAFLILVVIGSQLSRVLITFPGIPPQHAWSGLVLIGMGLLITGFSNRPLPITIGLLTWLSGFEILYASVQSSLLMAGLLTGVNLALSLAGAYFLLAGQMEQQV
ncbi:MAG: hypothetical protein A2Z16_11935 [Chloroflexi bacterium RBG_16_54_18]|nr:MAG: hypothetical protein A2Z16_11935 [Chloroflexi bacterium RBG_16_54_18]